MEIGTRERVKTQKAGVKWDPRKKKEIHNFRTQEQSQKISKSRSE